MSKFVSLVFPLLSAVLVAARLNEVKTTNRQGLHVVQLIPGDSPEMERRRKERRRQLSKGTKELNEKALMKRQVQQEEGGGDESPLDLQRDVLYEGYGTHYVDIWMGCGEPQRVTVIVDTGSSFTGFPCSGCQNCGGKQSGKQMYHTDDVYSPDLSTCFATVDKRDDCWLGLWNDGANTCRASAHYSEGSSWSAFEATDRVYTGGDHKQVDAEREVHESFSLHFGCQDSVAGLFETQLADGIMGMKVDKTSFWNQMYEAGKLEQAAFSLCFSKPGHVERTGTAAGAMVLGGSDTRLHGTKMVFAKQMANNGKYVVHLEKVYLQDAETGELNDVQITEEDLNNRGEVIVDSGTTGTYLTSKLARPFMQLFHEIVPAEIMQWGGASRYALTKDELESLPTIVFQMKAAEIEDEPLPKTTSIPGVVGQDLNPKYAGKSVLVAMPPSHYLTRDQGDSYVLDVSFSQGIGRGGVLGANLMRGQDVFFDVKNDRIGFANSDCEYKVIADDENEN